MTRTFRSNFQLTFWPFCGCGLIIWQSIKAAGSVHQGTLMAYRQCVVTGKTLLLSRHSQQATVTTHLQDMQRNTECEVNSQKTKTENSGSFCSFRAPVSMTLTLEPEKRNRRALCHCSIDGKSAVKETN